MGWACGTYGGEEKCIQGFGEGTPMRKKEKREKKEEEKKEKEKDDEEKGRRMRRGGGGGDGRRSREEKEEEEEKKKTTWKSYCVISSRRFDRTVVPSSCTGSHPRTP